MNYLIDCGTHLGEGLYKHIQNYNVNEDWKIYSFEANPNTYNLFQSIKNTEHLPDKYKWLKWSNIIFENKAVWTEDTVIDFYPSYVDQTSELLKNQEYIEFLAYHDSLVQNGDLIIDHQRQVVPIDGSSTLFPKHFQNNLKNNGNVLQKNLVWDKKCEISGFNFSKWLQNIVTKDDYVICKLDIEGAEFDVLNACILDNSIELIDVLNVEFHYFDDNKLITQYNDIMDKLKSFSLKINGW
jgi:FkbM family methyltransferase